MRAAPERRTSRPGGGPGSPARHLREGVGALVRMCLLEWLSQRSWLLGLLHRKAGAAPCTCAAVLLPQDDAGQPPRGLRVRSEPGGKRFEPEPGCVHQARDLQASRPDFRSPPAWRRCRLPCGRGGRTCPWAPPRPQGSPWPPGLCAGGLGREDPGQRRTPGRTGLQWGLGSPQV